MWIEDLPNGKYKYFERYRDPLTEKWRRVSVTLDKKTPRAQKVAQVELSDKIGNALASHTTSDVLFSTLVIDWWIFYKQSIKQSSISALTSSINYIKGMFPSETLIRNITTKSIQDKLISDKESSRNKIGRIKSMLNLMFDYAVDIQYIDDNPARRVRLPKQVKTVNDLEKIKNKYLTKTELSKLLFELYRRPNTYRLGLLAEFMSLNGCRMGEAIALEVKNYNRTNRTIDIHGTLDKTVGYAKGIKTTPKTNSSWRTVHLSDREVEILDELIKTNKLNKSLTLQYIDMDYIFVSKRGIPIQTNSFNLALKRANMRLENPINKNLSSHIFRHTNISLLAENNVPFKAIKERVGHDQGSKTTESIYTHVTDKMKTNITDVLNDFKL